MTKLLNDRQDPIQPGIAASDDDRMAAARLAAIVETSADAIISKQLDGTVISWNRAAETIFGFSAQEMIGANILKLIPPELHHEEREILQRISRGEAISHFETTRIRKDGRRITISLTISPVLDGSGAIVGAASIKRDISEYKRNEQILRQAAKMESIGRLAGGLAHDFNNHLHALSGFAHFISRDPNLTATSREDLAQIQKVAERMATLTHQLLAFARQQVLTPEVMDLVSVMDDAHPMLQRLVGSNYDLHVESDGNRLWVRVDRGQLIQVLMNLVINARDAMPAGGQIALRLAQVALQSSQFFDRSGNAVAAGDYVMLRVEDQGEGISPDELPRIFEPFYTTKEVGRGTGLGLATVDGIVSQSNGYIRVETAVGEGTRFEVLFPLFLTPASPSHTTRVRPVAGSQGRILVVDDDANVRTVVSRMLQHEGFDVVSAANGLEALKCLAHAQDSIDLVITDIVMPVMGGLELVNHMRASYPDVPAIWMSGHPRDAYEEAASSSQAFLQKPIKPEALIEAVRATISS